MANVVVEKEGRITKYGSSWVFGLDKADRDFLQGKDEELEKEAYTVRKQHSINKRGDRFIAFWLVEKNEMKTDV